MPQITINKKQIDALSAFLKKHDQHSWFLAKDDGAYIGAAGGSHDDDTFENIIFYFRGMDPAKNDGAWDAARYAFGGDDFGEHFDAAIIHELAAEDSVTKMIVRVTENKITIKSARRVRKSVAA